MTFRWRPSRIGASLTAAPAWSIQLEPRHFTLQIGGKAKRFDIIDAGQRQLTRAVDDNYRERLTHTSGVCRAVGFYSGLPLKKAATVPGKRISDLQVIKYKELRGRHSQEAAGAKTGISVATARRIESMVVLPSQKPARHWRTRADPLSQVWETEVVPMLRAAPSLMAVTMLEELQQRHPERFSPTVLRTL